MRRTREATTMSRFPDYYSILNITMSASQDEVRQAYRKESLRYLLDFEPDPDLKILQDTPRPFSQCYKRGEEGCNGEVSSNTSYNVLSLHH